MFCKLVKTGDGSHSLYVEELKEHYHSIHGAIQESKHVFIEAGFKKIASEFSMAEQKRLISILEIGLGTGLNVLLTILESRKLKSKVNYTTLEAFPLPAEITSALNYTDLLAVPDHSTKDELKFIFDNIHSAGWNKEIELVPQLKLTKLHTTLQEVQLQHVYDLIYFDAFGPGVQPEMWTSDVFDKIANAMNDQGVLVTYCAKGSVKRTLKAVGFKVETLAGPPGKREMIRAVKNPG